MKVLRPPYRLYVIADQKNKELWVVDWEHKPNQEKTLNQLKGKLAQAVNFGFSKAFA